MKKREFEMQHDPDRIVTMYGSIHEEKIDFNNFIDICEWCRNYGILREKNGDSNPRERLTISLYQFIQIKNNYGEQHLIKEHAQASAACCIHLLASVHQAGFLIYPTIDEVSKILYLDQKNHFEYYQSHRLLVNFSRISQQINYKLTCPKNSARNGRISNVVVDSCTREIVNILMSNVKGSLRPKAFQREMNLLLNQEWKR